MKKSLLALDLPLFQENVKRFRETLGELARPGEHGATILPVTKYLDRDNSRTLLEAGFGPLGENRSDQLMQKTDPGQDPDCWHFIGRLQRNKISVVAPRICMLHSLDSERLAASLDAWVEDHLVSPLAVLVQVNIAGETLKAGIDPVLAPELILNWVSRFRSLRFEGLMTMPPDLGAEQCRPVFRQLRLLRDSIRDQLSSAAASSFSHLSMGMSGDWQVAAEEGATLIRIGRALFLPPGLED
jgi:pyridoxal phosphate enzyme (YggS family)